ncbi:MAG: hypothetical protein K2M06_05220 [Muribaculaceae bacterium]|nr:hypothetical protein [Muribaculaceae bacterium]
MTAFAALGVSGGGHARSIELRFSDGTTDMVELDSTMVMEFDDGEIRLRTSRGHINLAPEGLKGWTFSEEPSVPLLNDMVTSEAVGSELKAPGIRVSVEGRRVAVRGCGRDGVVMSDAEGRIVRGACADGDYWVSPELCTGVYFLRHGDAGYKIYVR